MCFYTPDVGKAFLRERSAYELLTTTSDNVAHVFTALINARIWNDEKFSFKRIVAEWNYFVFVLSCIRMFPGITNRLGKPSKEEQYIVEKNVNFWEGDYKDNEFMKAGYIGFASNDENEVVKDLKAYIKELEILNDGQAGEIEILTGENSELKEQLKDAETLQTNAQEKSERGAKLTTTQILHLVRHAQLDINKSSAQEWAAALHLISGCSENTLRQQFYNPTLSDGSKSKVETLYSQKLEELKAKNK